MTPGFRVRGLLGIIGLLLIMVILWLKEISGQLGVLTEVLR